MNQIVARPVQHQIWRHIELLLADSSVQRAHASEIALEWYEHIVDLYLDAGRMGKSEPEALEIALNTFGDHRDIAVPMRQRQRILAFRQALRWPAIVAVWVLVEAVVAPLWITPRNGFSDFGVFPIFISTALALTAVVVILRLLIDSISRFRVSWLRVVLSIEVAAVALFLTLFGVQVLFGVSGPVVVLTLTILLILGTTFWAMTRRGQHPLPIRKFDE